MYLDEVLGTVPRVPAGTRFTTDSFAWRGRRYHRVARDTAAERGDPR